ncbi:MAG: lipoyl(octanoyl) transferase LipB [Bdellovibrionales bacterium]|jgi:lipoyl(octanoyl) transferase|nr:lipoyl(octanoyl) transferase LipB [Bdellovibrionales bacterium]
MSNAHSRSEYQAEYLGRISYDRGLTAQEEALLGLESENTSVIVLGLEHDPVITLGIRGKIDVDLLVSESSLLERGFVVRKSHRGGQATLHVPGQLVIYPICDLRKLGLGARDYVCVIEKATGSWLTSLGVQWQRSEDEPGIFVGSEKLVAFGFRIAHGKSSHGLAINVTNSPTDFSLIRTCGVGGQLVTNLKAQGAPTDLPKLFSSWLTHFYLTLDEPACRGLA